MTTYNIVYDDYLTAVYKDGNLFLWGRPDRVCPETVFNFCQANNDTALHIHAPVSEVNEGSDPPATYFALSQELLTL